MRAIWSITIIVPLLGLAACGRIQKAVAVQECTKGFEHSEEDVSASVIAGACSCAVDRQMAAGRVDDMAGAGTPLERRAYRDHIPQCLAANGGSATGAMARESQGPPHRLHVFDPATHDTSDPNPPLPPLPGTVGARDGPAPPPEHAPPGLDPGQSSAGPVPVAAANVAIVRNRSSQALQCGQAGSPLERLDTGDFDVAPGHHYCADPVQPAGFALEGGHTYDIGPFSGGELFIHDVTPAR